MLDRPYLTTKEAADRSDLTQAYITHLLRRGKLEGFQLSRDWLVYTDSLEKFLSSPRKPGPGKLEEKPKENLRETQ